MTAAQREGARFLLAELRRLHDARLAFMQLHMGCVEVADVHGLALAPFVPDLSGINEAIRQVEILVASAAGAAVVA